MTPTKRLQIAISIFIVTLSTVIFSANASASLSLSPITQTVKKVDSTINNITEPVKEKSPVTSHLVNETTKTVNETVGTVDATTKDLVSTLSNVTNGLGLPPIVAPPVAAPPISLSANLTTPNQPVLNSKNSSSKRISITNSSAESPTSKLTKSPTAKLNIFNTASLPVEGASVEKKIIKQIKKFGFPLLLMLIVIAYLMFNGVLDKKNPKLSSNSPSIEKVRFK